MLNGNPFIKFSEQNGILHFLELEDYADHIDNHIWKRSREWGPTKPEAKPTEAEESGKPTSTNQMMYRSRRRSKVKKARGSTKP